MESLEILAQLNHLASLCGKKIVMYNEVNETLIKMEEI